MKDDLATGIKDEGVKLKQEDFEFLQFSELQTNKWTKVFPFCDLEYEVSSYDIILKTNLVFAAKKIAHILHFPSFII